MVQVSIAILALVQFLLAFALSPPSLAQEWALRKPRGTLTIVDLLNPASSVMENYAESLVALDKDNNWVPGLAKDWRWLDDRTIEFKLRADVWFHNGEKFNAETVRVNWGHYRKMASPTWFRFMGLRDETLLEVIDDYTVRFIFPEPDSLAFVKLRFSLHMAPAFFADHEFEEPHWGYLPEPGPWGTGPFKLVEGNARPAGPSDRAVLEAYEDYWDPRYPKVKRVIFDNTLLADRKEAMRLCRETEGKVDIVTHIRPLDTLKVAESPFAKVVKSRDVTLLVGMLNQRKWDSKWRDIRVRKALNYAINREELWKYAAKGNAYNLEGLIIPPRAFGHNPNLTPYTYDTTKARASLAEAGYADGFEVKIITYEAWKLEAQIMSKMLEREGLRVTLDVLAYPEWLRKVYHPLLDKPPEEQDWDISISIYYDWYGQTNASFLNWGYIEESDMRWIDYDPVFEEMWKDMARTVDPEALGKKVRQVVAYAYDRAYQIFIYSPISLYAVNKEVNFVPQKYQLLSLKETSVTDSHWSIREED